MSVFKKILSVFNDLTDHTVLADDTVSANIKTKDNFLTKEFEENLLAFYDQMPAQMKNSVYHDNYVFFRETMIEGPCALGRDAGCRDGSRNGVWNGLLILQ